MEQFLHLLPRRALFTAYRTCIRHSLPLRSTFPKSAATQRRRYTDRAGQASTHQANPLGGYYTLLLDSPLTLPPPPSPSPSPPELDTDLPPSIPSTLFGSRTSPSSMAERKAARDAHSTIIAGIKVPPRPEEPDDCCMSGCVNCVWDLYRDEMEEWAARSREARERSLALGQGVRPSGVLAHVGGRVDDDGGGSEALWGKGEEELFGDIPVGIREFMRTEKRLKERRRVEGVVAG